MPEDSLSPPPRGAALSIREAQASDLDDLVALEAKAFQSDRLSRRSFAALARSPSAHLGVARIGPRVCGYFIVLARRGSRSARLYSIAVDPGCAGQGFGARLLATAEEVARRNGAPRLRLEVRPDNEAAIRLYERAGYRLIGRREGYYEDGAAALRYTRDLPAAGTAAPGPVDRAA